MRGVSRSLGTRPALDGLRGVAVLLVVGYHSWGPPGGSLGVQLFFVLSGFLITALLLEEWEASGAVDLARFYLRRALRLLPALVALLAVLTVAVLLAGDPTARATTLGHLPSALLYAENWHMLAAPGGSLLEHTWSLSVEEQFYIAWPLLLIVALRSGGERAVAVVAAAGVLGAGVIRLALWHQGAPADRIYYGTDTRADALLLGCLAAVVWRRIDWRPGPLTAVLAAEVLALPVVSPVATIVALPTATLCGAALTLYAAADGGPLLRWRPLRAVGRISYGVYLWHFPISAVVTNRLGGRGPVALLLVVALTIPCALLSYHLVERPFLRLKQAARARRTLPASTPAPADASVGLPGDGPPSSSSWSRSPGRLASPRTAPR